MDKSKSVLRVRGGATESPLSFFIIIYSTVIPESVGKAPAVLSLKNARKNDFASSKKLPLDNDLHRVYNKDTNTRVVTDTKGVKTMELIFSKKMTQVERINALQEFISKYHKGMWVHVEYTRELPILKGYIKKTGKSPIVTKETTSVVAFGIDYRNSQEYAKHCHNRTYVNQVVLNEFFTRNEKTGLWKIKVWATSNGKSKSIYKVNGVVIDKETLKSMECVSSSEFAPKTPTEIFEIKVNNIVRISYGE